MNDPKTIILVITTVASRDDADTLADALVARSLAACVQIDGPITSHYRWDGKIQRESEFRLMIKSSDTAWVELKRTLASLHPYDEPEIIMLPITDVTDGYRDWVIDQTT